MIEWRDEAIILSSRPHGETSAVVQTLTREHGRHAGLLRGGQSRKVKATLQPGNLVDAAWRARLPEHLGEWRFELSDSPGARMMHVAERLAALTAATAVSERALPERESHPACFTGLKALIAALQSDHWAEAYVVWELQLLKALGYGLDLSACAGGGDNDQLAFVSPRSGRAVSLAAGEPYRDRLLQLPGFLVGRGEGGRAEVAQGLRLTAFFLEQHIFHPQDRALPPARQRLSEMFPIQPSPAGG
jgi:DNA repair protein RecO (recombination protein O)